MNDLVYDAFHAWRRQFDAALACLRASTLQALAAELRAVAGRIDDELRARQSPVERRDARLFRQRGES